MWTLKHELAAYIMLPFFYMLPYKNRRIILIFTVILFVLSIIVNSRFFLFNLPVGTAWVLSENEYPFFILFLYYFMAESCLYLCKDKILFRSDQIRSDQAEQIIDGFYF
nr:hypothetical protein [Aggregatibacter actinomycetemcomitans]